MDGPGHRHKASAIRMNTANPLETAPLQSHELCLSDVGRLHLFALLPLRDSLRDQVYCEHFCISASIEWHRKIVLHRACPPALV